MSDCRWVSSDQPRMLRTHERDCNTSDCPGCQPCTERHCALCGIEHVTHEGRGEDQVCAGCIGIVRTDIRVIVDMAGRLLTEAVHRGVNSEATNLAGPTIDSAEGHEAWGYRAMSAAMGRIPALDDDPQHPLWVLGTWSLLVREHYDQPDQRRITLPAARDYLDGHLSRLAHDIEFAFEELARDVRVCRGHLEDVLRDGERDERTRVPCLTCGARLVRQYAEAAAADHHKCPRCKRTYNAGEFARAKADWLAAEEADRYVLISDAAKAVERPEFTVRTWMRRGSVGAMCDRRTHRLMVWWPDVRDQHRESTIRELQRKGPAMAYDLNNVPGVRHA